MVGEVVPAVSHGMQATAVPAGKFRGTEATKQYIQAAVPRAEFVPEEGKAEFVLVGEGRLEEAVAVAKKMPEEGMLVCEGIHGSRRAREIWRAIQQSPHTGVTFDLYTYGVAFFNPKLHKQHYKVNF